MVNKCGHFICSTCVDLLFDHETGFCPICDQPLRKTDYRKQTFESPHVERDVMIRKEILEELELNENNFRSYDEYDDYIERIETIVYNLIYNIDEENTKNLISDAKIIKSRLSNQTNEDIKGLKEKIVNTLDCFAEPMNVDYTGLGILSDDLKYRLDNWPPSSNTHLGGGFQDGLSARMLILNAFDGLNFRI